MTTKTKEKTLVISGGSKGIGLAIAHEFATHNIKVYELSRSGKNRPGIRHIKADVTNPESVKGAIREIIQESGQINYLVCNAGFGIAGPLEFTSPQALKRQFEVNVFGAVYLIQAALPFMPENAGSRIFFTSSVAAVTPIPFQAFYSASKSSLNQIALALYNELHPFGISVCAIMPGDLATNFTQDRHKDLPPSGKYASIAKKSLEKMEADEKEGPPPDKLAKTIYRLAVQKLPPKPIRGFSPSYRLLLVLAKLLPVRIMNFILRLMYAR